MAIASSTAAGSELLLHFFPRARVRFGNILGSVKIMERLWIPKKWYVGWANGPFLTLGVQQIPRVRKRPIFVVHAHYHDNYRYCNRLDTNKQYTTSLPIHNPSTECTFTVHLIDVLLICTQNNDTPLHIACRFGCEDIVAFLVTMPGINREIKNKYGETPSDVVCSRVNKSEALVQRIRQLLKGVVQYR